MEVESGGSAPGFSATTPPATAAAAAAAAAAAELLDQDDYVGVIGAFATNQATGISREIFYPAV
jgi:hypothetical protein